MFRRPRGRCMSASEGRVKYDHLFSAGGLANYLKTWFDKPVLSAAEGSDYVATLDGDRSW